MSSNAEKKIHGPESAEDKEKLEKDSVLITHELRTWWVLKVIGPIERLLISSHVTPNQITLATTALCFVGFFLYAQGQVLLAGWFVLILGSLDILDGRVARATNRVTPGGAFLDSVMDRYQDFILLSGLAFFYRHSWVLVWVLLAIMGSLLVSYIRAKAEDLGVEIKKIGVMQRPERVFLLGFGSLLSGIFQSSLRPFYGHGEGSHVILIFVIFVLALATNWTAFQRIRYSLAELDRLEEKK